MSLASRRMAARTRWVGFAPLRAIRVLTAFQAEARDSSPLGEAHCSGHANCANGMPNAAAKRDGAVLTPELKRKGRMQAGPRLHRRPSSRSSRKNPLIEPFHYRPSQQARSRTPACYRSALRRSRSRCPRWMEHQSLCSATGMPHSTQMCTRCVGAGGFDEKSRLRNDIPGLRGIQ